MLNGLQPDRGVDKSRCADEPIHIPGSIQPHGLLFVLAEPQLKLANVSANLETMLGIPVATACGSGLARVLGSVQAARLEEAIRRGDPPTIMNPMRFVVSAGGTSIELECVVHRSGATAIVELEPYEMRTVPNPLDVFAHVRAPIAQMEDAPDTATLVRDAAAAVREISGFDRAMIYWFDEDCHGDVISESTADGVPVTYLGLRFPATDIPEQARRLYLRSPLRLIADASYVPAPLVPQADPQTGAAVDLSGAILRSASPIHREYLHNMGVRATLTISIVIRGRLWGVIACHHLQPRRVDYVTRAACEFFGRMLAWQLENRMMAESLQQRLRAYSLIGSYARSITSSNDYEDSFSTNGQELLDLFGAHGLVVQLDGRLRRFGATPADDALVGQIAARLQQDAVDGVAASHQVGTIVPAAASVADEAGGALLITLSERGDEYLICLREEIVRPIDWAGDIRTPVWELEGRLHPRTSFALWRETVHGQSLRWSALDIESAQHLRTAILERALSIERRSARDRLRYIAHHDQLTRPIGRRSTTLSRTCSSTPSARGACSRCCSSIWITSSRSTTRWAMPPATRFCRQRERGCAAACATTTWLPGWAATSS